MKVNKNILILGFSALTFISCSNDDDDSPETAAKKKYPESFVLTQYGQSKTTTISYNDKMQITGYSEPNSVITFSYETGKVKEVRENGNSLPYALSYTNGILSGLSHYGQPYTVTYNSQQASYTVGNLLTFGLNGRDVAYVNDNSENQIFTYDSNKKGALYDLPDAELFPVTLFSTFQYYYLATKPVQTITLVNNGVQNVVNALNTYDSDGYITSMTAKSGNSEIFKVTYKYMVK